MTYWRERPAPDLTSRLGAERHLLLTAGTQTAVGRPVLADGRLLLVVPGDDDLAERLVRDHTVTLTPCDSRGRPRTARPFDVVDPVATSRPAEPVPATARPSPADAREATIRLATKARTVAPAVDTLRRLTHKPAPPPLVLELTVTAAG